MMRIGEGGVSDDTFFGYTDDTGVGIRSITLTAYDSTVDLYPAFDGLAFAVPEPASALVLAAGACAGLRRRPRSRNRRGA
jgi:hypothetical protein